MSIVVVGAIFVDIKGYPLAAYKPGERNSGTVRQVHGGVCRNIAEDLAHLGIPVRLVSLADDTALGQDVVDRLRREQVDTRFIRRCTDGMGCWLAVFDGNGDVQAEVSKRPDLTPMESMLDEQGDEIFADADSVLLELDLEEALLCRVLKYAEKYRLPVYAAVSNMTIASRRRKYLQKCQCLVCNDREADTLFGGGCELRPVEEIRACLPRHLAGLRLPRMVVTLGARGAVFADAQGISGHCPSDAVTVRDTTGAGDAFFSGCAAALTCGRTLADACRLGSKMAAAVIATTDNVCPRSLQAEWL